MADNYTGQPIINASGTTLGEGIIRVAGSFAMTTAQNVFVVSGNNWAGTGSVYAIGSVNIAGNPANWAGVGSTYISAGSVNINGVASVAGSVAITNTPAVNAYLVSGAVWAGVGSVLVTGSVNIAGTASVAGSVAITNTVSVNVVNESNLANRNTFLSGTAVAAGGSLTNYLSTNAAGSLFVKSFEYTATVPLKVVIGWSGVVSTSGQGNFLGVGFAQNDNMARIIWDQDYVLPSGTGSVMEVNIFNRSLTVAADVYGKWSAGQLN